MEAGRQQSCFAKGLAISALVALAGWAGIHAWQSNELRRVGREIVSLSGVRSMANFRDKVAQLQTFINDNSQHRQDDEFYATWRDQTFLAQRLVDGVNDQRQNRVHLECSTRTALMILALEEMGLTTRRIDIYDAQALRSHTFLDVLNPQTGAFETHDPDFDITWRDRATLKPVSIAETAADLEQVEPCGRTACGWNVVSREKFKAEKLKEYFDFISIKSEKRHTVYTPRAVPTAIYDHENKHGAFCEIFAENCRDGFFDIRTQAQTPHR